MVNCGIDQTINLHHLLTAGRIISFSDHIPHPPPWWWSWWSFNRRIILLYCDHIPPPPSDDDPWQGFMSVQCFLYLLEPVQLMAFIGRCYLLNSSTEPQSARKSAEVPKCKSSLSLFVKRLGWLWEHHVWRHTLSIITLSHSSLVRIFRSRRNLLSVYGFGLCLSLYNMWNEPGYFVVV